MSNNGHASLSASQTKQWTSCPGSTAYIEANPHLRDSSGYHAQMGTCAHALIEHCLNTGAEPEAMMGRLLEIIELKNGGEDVKIHKPGAKWPKGADKVVFEADQDMIEAIEYMVEYVRGRMKELNVDPATDVKLEVKVNPLPHRKDTGGSGDVIIDAWPVLIEVVDYKHGSGVFVPVQKNQQLRSYGLGALHDTGCPEDYEKVVYTICQPRHKEAPFGGIMSEEISVLDLLEWGNWLSACADKVDFVRGLVKDGADLESLYEEGFISVGEEGDHCTFCPLKTGCPAALAKVQEMTMVDFADDPEEIEPASGANHLAMTLPWIPFLKKYIKASEEKADEIMFTGGNIEGFKVVAGQSKRGFVTTRRIAPKKEGDEPEIVVVTEDDIVKALTKEYKIPKDKVLVPAEAKMITGPQAEKLIPKSKRKEFNDKWLHKPEGKPKVVPNSSKKPALNMNPADDFDDDL